MASIPVKQGDPIPLHIQLDDFAAGLYPRAIVKDDGGAAFATVDLDTDTGDGLYVDKSLSMPGKNLIATYQVFTDAARTQLRDNEAGVDIIILDSFDTLRRDDKIYGHLASAQSIEGRLSAVPMVGVFDGGDLVGQVKDPGYFKGEIDDDEITGRVHRC